MALLRKRNENSTSVLMLASALDGHRKEYLDLFRRIFQKSGVASDVSSPSLGHVFDDRVVFCPMLEEFTFKFIALSIARSLLGKRSCALLFRAGEAAHYKNFKMRLKRGVLRGLRWFSDIKILTIIPFWVDDAFDKISDGWIYDPQLWDIIDAPVTYECSSLEYIRKLALGRKIVISLGGQNYEKGFNYFSDILASNPELKNRFLFVAAGKVAASSRDSAVIFERSGGILEDRFIDDLELMWLYEAASAVWACYSPSYNQASGIFGRAVQLGKIVLVRKGSYLEKMAVRFEHPVIPMLWEVTELESEFLGTNEVKAPMERLDLVTSMKKESILSLSAALGVNLVVEY